MTLERQVGTVLREKLDDDGATTTTMATATTTARTKRIRMKRDMI